MEGAAGSDVQGQAGSPRDGSAPAREMEVGDVPPAVSRASEPIPAGRDHTRARAGAGGCPTCGPRAAVTAPSSSGKGSPAARALVRPSVSKSSLTRARRGLATRCGRRARPGPGLRGAHGRLFLFRFDRLYDPGRDGPPGKNHRLSERIRARVLLLIGDEAQLTTEHRGTEDPERVPVGRLVAETGIPRARLVGADVVAVIGDAGELERFERTEATDGIR